MERSEIATLSKILHHANVVMKNYIMFGRSS
jgi:hypothetical protein